MRFGDFLKTTVLTSATGASALIVATLAGANGTDDTGVVWVALGWWLVAVIIGTWMGRGTGTSESIGSLLAAARTQTTLPDLAPMRTFVNRLWPLMICTIIAAALAALWPQVPAVAGGFMIIWAFAWRRQAGAVKAIEDRDGARFYIDRTSPFASIRLVRTPGFRATLVELNEAGSVNGVGSGQAPPSGL